MNTALNANSQNDSFSNKVLKEINGKKCLNVYIVLRFSFKVKIKFFQYIKNEIPIPDKEIKEEYPKDTRNDINARENKCVCACVLNSSEQISPSRHFHTFLIFFDPQEHIDSFRLAK